MPNEEYGEDILTLQDEEGQEHQFEVVDTMEIGDDRYMALVPVFDDAQEMLEDEDELIVLKVIPGEDGEDYLEPIENEDEFDRIAALFMERLEEDFEFTDGDEEEDDEDEE